MPIRRRTDGFSDDGLSYSVASDFDKQIGQAMAEQEARLADPRFAAGARIEQPDTPDILQRELIDPVLTAFGMDTRRRVADSRGTGSSTPYSLAKLPGGDTASFDRRTGNLDIIGGNPIDDRLARFKLDNLKSESAGLRTALSDPFKSKAMTSAEVAAANARLAAINAEAEMLLSKQQPQVVEAPQDLIQPSGFIGNMTTGGEPSGENRFAGRSVPVKPGQVGETPQAPAVKDRRKGTVYITPRGQLKWTGTGWVQP